MAEYQKSIEEIEAELDKEFYDEFIKLAGKYKRTLTSQLVVARLTDKDLKNGTIKSTE
jgi:vacuolar-type H+-ATPase subunit C/Vma6